MTVVTQATGTPIHLLRMMRSLLRKSFSAGRREEKSRFQISKILIMVAEAVFLKNHRKWLFVRKGMLVPVVLSAAR
jgi:hypothetical protein